MSNWIKITDNLPRVSYLEGDYDAYPVLVFSPEKPGNCCVAYIVMDKNEDSKSYGQLSWEMYIPGVCDLQHLSLKVFTHWMPLPNSPNYAEGCHP